MVSKNLLLTNDLYITNFFIPNHSQYLNPLISLSCPSPRCLSYISKFVTHLFRRCSLHLVSLPKSHFNSHFPHFTSFPSYTYQHFLFSSVCLWGLDTGSLKTWRDRGHETESTGFHPVYLLGISLVRNFVMFYF